MNPTKDNIEKMLYYLSDKTLSTGATDSEGGVYSYNPLMGWGWAKDNSFNSEPFGKIIGRPVMIGDCLEKLPLYSQPPISCFDVKKAERLMLLWKPHGFTTSLNEILSEEVVKPEDVIALNLSVYDIDKFRDPNTQSLWEFLCKVFGDKIKADEQ